MNERLARAVEELKRGNFIVLYDGDKREGEADLVFHAKFSTPEKIEKMRKEGGGLICVALSEEIAKSLSLPFLTDIFAKDSRLSKLNCNKTAYGDKPAFSISVNHKGIYTGIPDNDRSITIKKLAEVKNVNEFEKEFYTPGHVFLLIGRGIENRKGHTELSLELARLANLHGTMVLCEMLGKGKALDRKKAEEYAKKNNLVFIEGRDITMFLRG